MATLIVREVPDDVVRRLDVRAAAAGRSREAEIRTLLAETTRPDPDWAGFLAAADAARRQLPTTPLSDSVEDLATARFERQGEPA